MVCFVGDTVRVFARHHPSQRLPETFSLADARQFLEAILSSPSLHMLVETDRHRHVASEVFAEVPGISGNLIFDAHTAILMRENGVKTIYTRDTDFNRFPFLDVVDPITERRRTTESRRRGHSRA